MGTQQQSQEQPTGRRILWAGAAVVLLTIAVLIGYRYGITLWDWIKLLVVPAAIAIAGLWFNRQQQERQREAENERTRDGVLQAYLDKIGQLLLDRDRPLSQAVKGDDVSTLARSLTLTALSQLDGRRKGTLIQFLSEAVLIQRDPRFGVWDDSEQRWRQRSGPVIELTSADLSSIVLTSDDADLTWADLSDAKGTNKEQLEQAKSLEGAIMPDGQKYEDWLKDRARRKEDA